MINIPKQVGTVLQRLNWFGHEAYIVGGCVRDSILEREPKDWDVTTSATPQRVIEVFKEVENCEVIPTGIDFGTVTVLLDKMPVEVTTYRIDGKYSDSRHPDGVEYATSLKDDLSRRDFTMNAIAFHPDTGMQDPYGGMDDICKKLIRTVGKCEDRFSEDPLRMLRAVRFSAQLGFYIAPDILDFIDKQSCLMKKVSVERVQEELNKILMSDNPEVLRKGVKLFQYILPHLENAFHTTQRNPYHMYTVGEHTVVSIKEAPKDLVIRLTMLLHDLGKIYYKTTDSDGIDHFYNHALGSIHAAHIFFDNARYSNDIRERVITLVMHHDTEFIAEKRWVRRQINKLGADVFEQLIEVRRADIMAQSPTFRLPRLHTLTDVERLYHEIRNTKECTDVKSLAINGKTLLAIGFGQGPLIGRTLKWLTDMVILDPTYNNVDALTAAALKIKNTLEEDVNEK